MCRELICKIVGYESYEGGRYCIKQGKDEGGRWGSGGTHIPQTWLQIKSFCVHPPIFEIFQFGLNDAANKAGTYCASRRATTVPVVPHKLPH